MKLKITLLIFLSSKVLILFSQNLVPNNSFEDYSNLYCGWINNNTELVGTTNNWLSASSPAPDIFSHLIDSTCWNYIPNSYYTNPTECILGVQNAKSGNFMAGLYTHGVGNYREYLQAKLKTPLVIGHQYCFSMFVSLADSVGYATNNLGMALSDTSVFVNTTLPLSTLTPIIKASSVILDKENWVKIAGTLIASSNSQYILIGNFNGQAQTQTQNLLGTCHPNSAYYFIDDIDLHEINPNITLNFAPEVCQNQNIQISASGAESYKWVNTINPNEIISTDSAFTYNITSETTLVLFSNICELILTDTLKISALPLPMFNLGSDTIVCNSNHLTLQAPNNAINYAWSNGLQTPSILIENEDTYWLNITDINNCNYTDTIKIKFYEKPTQLYSINLDTFMCSKKPIQINAPNGFKQYLWNDNDSDQKFVIMQGGNYTLQLTDTFNCTYNQNFTVTEQNCDCLEVSPTAFSPNNDGINDTYTLKFNCPINNYLLMIFNKWGEKLFETTDANNTWNGTYKNKKCEIGTYVSIISYKNSAGKQILQKQLLTLVR